MRDAPGLSDMKRCAPCALLAVGAALVSAPALAASDVPPEVGYNYGQVESPRIAALGGALRASSNSTEALFINPANMATSRVYHIGALAQIWPESSRQTYGLGIVDSIVSASRLAGGLGGTFNRQDPEGVDRTSFDVRFALAYPFSEHFFIGGSGRYLSLKQGGFPRGIYALPPSQAAAGTPDSAIVQTLTFDAGLTLKPADEFAISLVGYDLTDPGTGFLPLMLGGGLSYGTRDYSLEIDAIGDFTTYESSKARVMGGGELLVADHFPLRAGYRFDQGAKSHTISGGFGYIDNAYTLDLSIGRVVSGDAVTIITIGFKYHVESAGIAEGGD
jgi:opacity protein-like surface antigen